MSIIKHLTKLYEEKRELTLLQWSYLAIIIASVLVAGIIALVERSVGVATLIVPLVAFVAMAMNIVVWALVRLVADSFFVKKKPATKSTKKK